MNISARKKESILDKETEMRSLHQQRWKLPAKWTPVFMNACPDILHSSKPTRHPGIGVELLHDGLSHSEVVGVSSGLQGSTHQLELTSDTCDPS